MMIRSIFLASTLVAAMPAPANAANHDSMSAACGRAFAEQLGLTSGVAPAYKLTGLPGDSESSVERFYSEDFVLDLVAHAPKTWAVIAKASCVVTANGKVISLETQPIGAAHRRIARP